LAFVDINDSLRVGVRFVERLDGVILAASDRDRQNFTRRTFYISLCEDVAKF
jgi:hypothetical protein